VSARNLVYAFRVCLLLDGKRTAPTTSSIVASNRPSGPVVFRAESVGKSGPKDPPQSELGLKRQIVDAPSHESDEKKAQRARERRRERHADQRTAGALYVSMTPAGTKAAGRGVTMCGWTTIANQQARLIRAEAGGKANAFYRGLQACTLRWVCPCCTLKKSEVSRGQLNDALAVARKRKLKPVMMTLTARHSKKMSLTEFWSVLSRAEQELKTTRAWKRLNKRLAGGFAKAVEVTHSERNGWHPHFHLVLLTDADDEAHAIELVETLRDEWLHQLSRVGLDGTSDAARKRAFDVRGASTVGEYITKWGAAEEMTLSSSKIGHAKGRTPWQLLRDARTADTDRERMLAGALWYEFVQVMQGVHQLRQSPAFRELVKAYVPPPPKGDPPEEPVETVVFRFGDPEWTYGRHKRILMREAAEDASKEDAHSEVRRVLLGSRIDADLWRNDEAEFDLIEDG